MVYGFEVARLSQSLPPLLEAVTIKAVMNTIFIMNANTFSLKLVHTSLYFPKIIKPSRPLFRHNFTDSSDFFSFDMIC